MNQFFLLYLSLLLTVLACAKPEREIEPQAAKADTCHMNAVAEVNYYQVEHEGYASFYYLNLLDAEGNWLEDVYPIRWDNQYKEAGKRLLIVYHAGFDGSEEFVYPSACGAGGDGDITLESMKKIAICTIEVGES
ncbi:MAG: hypothetical protein AAF587_07345 [Bacteroidota bacterium]